MLKDDIELIDNIVIKYAELDSGMGAWSRIKKFVEEAQNTSTNSKSMPCVGCGKSMNNHEVALCNNCASNFE